MTSSQRKFDLVLIIGYFRSALPMLSVIRHLSPRLSIGVRFQLLDSRMENKTGRSQELFEAQCLEAGATVCPAGSHILCRLMLVQQYPYTEEFVKSVGAEIKADKIWGMLTLAAMGIEEQDAFIRQFGVTSLTVQDRGLAEYLIDARGAKSRYNGIDMVEVGLPFRKYPVFPSFAVDWLVAAPTLFSFHTEGGKQRFLRDVLQLMEQIPAADVVAYKSHNGNIKDYFTPRAHAELARYINWVPKVESLLTFLAKYLPRIMGSHCARILTAILHARVMRRAVPMGKLTPYADMSLEAFLPGVRKGVIGGLSNTVWGTSFFGLPYYNCVAPEERESGRSELLNKSSENLLDLNMAYFGVPYCQGDMASGAITAKIVYDSKKHNNLVDVVALACETA